VPNGDSKRSRGAGALLCNIARVLAYSCIFNSDNTLRPVSKANRSAPSPSASLSRSQLHEAARGRLLRRGGSRRRRCDPRHKHELRSSPPESGFRAAQRFCREAPARRAWPDAAHPERRSKLCGAVRIPRIPKPRNAARASQRGDAAAVRFAAARSNAFEKTRPGCFNARDAAGGLGTSERRRRL